MAVEAGAAAAAAAAVVVEVVIVTSTAEVSGVQFGPLRPFVLKVATVAEVLVIVTVVVGRGRVVAVVVVRSSSV